MRRLLILVAAALVVVQPGIQASAPGAGWPGAAPTGHQRDRDRRDQDREEQTERTTKTVRIGSDGELDVGNVAGDITVTRGTGADVTIEMVKTARARSAADAREMLGLVQVDIAERAGRAEVRTRYPRGDDRGGGNRRNVNVTVTFTISAPASARVTARSVSGNVTARDIKGDLLLESVSGNIVIAGGGRVNGAKTVSGDVEVTGTEFDGALGASSVSGTVTVRKSKARSLALQTVSGNLVAENVECGRVEMQAVSGDLQWAGTLSQSGRYDLTSHSGNIRVDSIGDRGFELDANSFSGSIRSDLPLTGQSAGQNERQQRRQRSLRGVHGNGSAVLDLTTFSGDIIVARR